MKEIPPLPLTGKHDHALAGVRQLLPDIHSGPLAMVHMDYWTGNILWASGKITAVLDWEEAAFGDPGYDVAYIRPDL